MTDLDDAQARQDYMAGLPAGITTPDRVETRLGTLEYWDGVPTKQTAELLYDNLDFLRGVETFLKACQLRHWKRCGAAWRASVPLIQTRWCSSTS